MSGAMPKGGWETVTAGGVVSVSHLGAHRSWIAFIHSAGIS